MSCLLIMLILYSYVKLPKGTNTASGLGLRGRMKPSIVIFASQVVSKACGFYSFVHFISVTVICLCTSMYLCICIYLYAEVVFWNHSLYIYTYAYRWICDHSLLICQLVRNSAQKLPSDCPLDMSSCAAFSWPLDRPLPRRSRRRWNIRRIFTGDSLGISLVKQKALRLNPWTRELNQHNLGFYPWKHRFDT